MEKPEYNIDKKYAQVDRSGIHHKGVFALQDIPKGTVIMEYTGIIMTKEESDMLMDQTAEKHRKDPEKFALTYIFQLDDDRFLDGDLPDNDAKYINHSCDPNCEVEIGKNSVWIITLRDIKKGEEITYNYGFEVDEYKVEDFISHRCRCGTKKCVGYILAEDEWPRIPELLEREKQFRQSNKVLN
ncbi:MAG TPA: SET domain-containing protein-lysine N-methyltransferase [Alphaproteobacteria bacterium]|nr:SET domain-containing protein-lysine N-methyltransferase [Alphaproteobacteria bacterium]